MIFTECDPNPSVPVFGQKVQLVCHPQEPSNLKTKIESFPKGLV